MSKLLLHNLDVIDINGDGTPLNTFIDSDIKGIIKQCLGKLLANKIEKIGNKTIQR